MSIEVNEFLYKVLLFYNIIQILNQYFLLNQFFAKKLMGKNLYEFIIKNIIKYYLYNNDHN